MNNDEKDKVLSKETPKNDVVSKALISDDTNPFLSPKKHEILEYIVKTTESRHSEPAKTLNTIESSDAIDQVFSKSTLTLLDETSNSKMPSANKQTDPIEKKNEYYIPTIWQQLTQDLKMGEYEAPQELKGERVYNFIHVPTQIEKLMIFGYLICLDATLFIFTILPLRIILAIFQLLKNGKSIHHNPDSLKFLIIVINCVLLYQIDASFLYHSIRGQSVIKLYVIFNVLEVCDRLCCSFGQDILDSFLSSSIHSKNQSARKSSVSPFLHFIISIAYSFAHSLVLFYQTITLNVAINSYNNGLLTLLISNQFVEIKGSVFKKFEKENLFQLACSDIVERFQLSSYLLIIASRNLVELGQLGINLDYVFGSLIIDIFIVLVSEIVVDWLKHSFITKFNHIRPIIYSKFMDVLCKDILGKDSSKLHEFTSLIEALIDLSPIVSRKIGFAAIPFVCFVIRILIQTLEMANLSFSLVNVLAAIFIYLTVLLLKLSIGNLLLRFSSYRYASLEKNTDSNHDFNIPQPQSFTNDIEDTKIKTAALSLENIDRYTLFKGSVP